MPATSTDSTAATTLIASGGQGTAAGAAVSGPAPVPPMPLPKARESLTRRIFVTTAGVVVVVLAVALAIASVVARRSANQTVAEALRQERARVRDELQANAKELTARAATFVDNPNFRSALAQSSDADHFDQAEVANNSIHSDWTQLIDARGARLAKSDDSTAAHADLSASPLIRGALAGDSTSAFGVASDSMLFQAVAVPVAGAAGARLGALMAARYANDALATAIGKNTGADIVFFSVGTDHRAHVTAATAGVSDRAAARAFVERQLASNHMWSDSMASAGDDRLALSGQQYVGQWEPLMSAGGTPVGGFLTLRSLDAELRSYYGLRNALLLTALFGVAAAFLLSGLMARQIARPVRALAVAAVRASDGDYAAEIPQAGRDEIGVLAGAFRRLLADLRDKQALVDLMGMPADRTQPIARAGATNALSNGAQLEPGQLLAGRYEILDVLGVGGMGMVYRANDRELGECVAIKTLKPELMGQDPSALDRFKSEIRLARRISHRNVVRTHDLGEAAGVYFISMEYVEGRALKDLIRMRGRLSPQVTLPIAKQLCRAMEVAHEAGVIHRDIKPQNVVIGPDGVVKVMDFGIARLAQGTSGYTQAGMVVGTPEYMAPEQLLGDDVDARADLYAMGAVIYECLTGGPPFTADSAITLITKVLEETPVSPSERFADIPAELSRVVLRTLDKDRNNRPRSAGELHDLLDSISIGA